MNTNPKQTKEWCDWIKELAQGAAEKYMRKSKPQKPPVIKKKKVKPLPNKPIPMGGGPFVGRHTTG